MLRVTDMDINERREIRKHRHHLSLLLHKISWLRIENPSLQINFFFIWEISQVVDDC